MQSLVWGLQNIFRAPNRALRLPNHLNLPQKVLDSKANEPNEVRTNGVATERKINGHMVAPQAMQFQAHHRGHTSLDYTGTQPVRLRVAASSSRTSLSRIHGPSESSSLAQASQASIQVSVSLSASPMSLSPYRRETTALVVHCMRMNTPAAPVICPVTRISTLLSLTSSGLLCTLALLKSRNIWRVSQKNTTSTASSSSATGSSLVSRTLRRENGSSASAISSPTARSKTRAMSSSPPGAASTALPGRPFHDQAWKMDGTM